MSGHGLQKHPSPSFRIFHRRYPSPCASLYERIHCRYIPRCFHRDERVATKDIKIILKVVNLYIAIHFVYRVGAIVVKNKFGDALRVEEAHERKQVRCGWSLAADLVKGDLPCCNNGIRYGLISSKVSHVPAEKTAFFLIALPEGI
jgi:hypothetical protein